MGIEKKDPANFSPSVEIPAKVDSFRFWCQKVLPLVYDDSLSYYELLCKVIDYLNNTIADVNTLGTDVDNLNNAYNELQSYVNDYFSTLDVQNEINNKLDVMAQDGSLSALIQPLFDTYKTEINSEVNQQNNKITVLENRMNTFTSLPSGSTSGDAELIDIRVPASGFNNNNVYANAGDAVRGQVGSLKKDIVDVYNDLEYYNSGVLKRNIDELLQGLLNESDGSFINNGSKSVRVIDYLKIDKYFVFGYEDKTINWTLYYYDKNKNFISKTLTYTGIIQRTAPNNTSYIRVGLYRESGLSDDEIRKCFFVSISKNASIINLKYLGAKGDGVSDDTLFIQLAINAGSEYGSTIYVPSGRYLYTGWLGEVKNCKIVGDFTDTDTAHGSIFVDGRSEGNTSAESFVIQFSERYTIENIAFYGNSKTRCCALFKGGWDSYITNVLFSDFYSTPVIIDNAQDLHFINLTLVRCGTFSYSTQYDSEKPLITYALSIRNGANATQFNNLHIEHCRHAIKVSDSGLVVFVNSKLEMSGYGINMNSEFPFILTNNTNIIFSGCSLVGIGKNAYELLNIPSVPFIKGADEKEQSITINGCFIYCGKGSSSASVDGLQNLEFININGTVNIQGSMFTYLSKNNSISAKDGIFGNNIVTFITEDSNETEKAIAITNGIINSNIFKNIAENDISAQMIFNNIFRNN